MKKNDSPEIVFPDMSGGVGRDAILAMVFVSIVCVAAVLFEVM